MALSLASQREAEVLDLLDELDSVDPATRAQIEGAIDRGEDLFELSTSVRDLALAPRSRDGAIALFTRVSYVRSSRAETSFLIGLRIDFDELLIPPEPYGAPPEQLLVERRCAGLARLWAPDRLLLRAREERLAALGCGGSG